MEICSCIKEGADSKKGGGRRGGRGQEVGDRGAGSGRGEICKMGEN